MFKSKPNKISAKILGPQNPVSCQKQFGWNLSTSQQNLVPRAPPHCLGWYCLHKPSSSPPHQGPHLPGFPVALPSLFLHWEIFVFTVGNGRLLFFFSFFLKRPRSLQLLLLPPARFHNSGLFARCGIYLKCFPLPSPSPFSSDLRALLCLFISLSLRRVFTVGVGWL